MWQGEIAVHAQPIHGIVEAELAVWTEGGRVR